MAKVFYKSSIPNDKPQWLLNVQAAVEDATRNMTLLGNERDFKNLKYFIDAEIEAQRSRGNLIRSEVTTNLVSDSGRTVINIFRGGAHIQSYYID